MERGVQAIVGYPGMQFILRLGSANLSQKRTVDHHIGIPRSERFWQRAMRSATSELPVIQPAPRSPVSA